MVRDRRAATVQDVPPSAPTRPEAVQLRARRSPRLITLGVLAIVLGALGAAALYSMNTDLHNVVVMSRDVVRGDVVQIADLTVVSMPSGSQIEMSPADALESMPGQRALTDLPAGAFPLPRHLGEEPVPARHAAVGMRLTAGRLPGLPLPPGTPVQLISLAEGDDTVVDAVTASSPVVMDDGTSQLLDVIVAEAFAAAVASLAATDQLVLIAVGDE